MGIRQRQDARLVFGDKVGDTMRIAMDPKQAKDWFGAQPPETTSPA